MHAPHIRLGLSLIFTFKRFNSYITLYESFVKIRFYPFAPHFLLCATIKQLDVTFRHTLQESGAFVYGILSSMDKISNGVVLQLVELFSPPICTTDGKVVDCSSFYHVVVVIVPGSFLIVAVIVLISLVVTEKCSFSSQQEESLARNEQSLEDSLPNGSVTEEPHKR
ncbi:unnamed protein product [Thelazia callipaeda]|uniref:DUF4792 domain-containing protein n=1 Tax=Thelazia callipaeda TaxID=103827 RepID=A0A0N5D7J4_THECL|nr:unnamed protein product [Thelazia callipaeda]